MCIRDRVTTADQMRQAVIERMQEATLVLKAAAVADYRPVYVSDQKLKRTGPMTIELAPTEDILAEVVRLRRPGQLIIGFAAETHDKMENGRAKLLRKGADAIVVNAVTGDGVGIEADSNAATFLTLSTSIELPLMPKRSLADRILDEVLTPVSYTHLDVYKRQGRGAGDGLDYGSFRLARARRHGSLSWKTQAHGAGLLAECASHRQ